MTGIYIADLPSDSSVDGNEKIPVSDNGTTKAVTIANISDYMKSALVSLNQIDAMSDDDMFIVVQNGTLKIVALNCFKKNVITLDTYCVVGNLLECNLTGFVLATKRPLFVALKGGEPGDAIPYATGDIQSVLFEDGAEPSIGDEVFLSVSEPGKATTLPMGPSVGQCVGGIVNGVARVCLNFDKGIQS